ncbi:MAG: sodium/hydrogen antiporter [Solirubrobacteraceae bacterium]|nr:sodium/hydrogen antiporter [Solirubrobacteraceae bacterium]
MNSLGDSIPVKLEIVLLVLGGLLMTGALVAGLVRRSFLSLAALFVLAGFALGQGGLEVLEFDARSGFVNDLAVIALIVILFRDGLEVEAEMLQKAWHLPFRKLALAMPITGALVALAAHWLVGLGWLESCLLGALLSPTDPVLSSSVVTNPRVPRLVRHSLNLESGLNDGLALPAVLAFTAALGADDDFVWWEFVLQDVTLGLAFGVVLAWIASKLMPRGRMLTDSIPAHAQALYALGVAFGIYGVAVGLPPQGNGFIAVFTGAITLGILRPDLRSSFEHRADEIVEIVKLGIFVVFGALLTVDGLFTDGWAAVALVVFTLLVARTVAVWIALAGTGVDTGTKAFMAWFGPKGVATMTFSLFVLGEGIPEGGRIFNLAALCVFTSVHVHGLTDTPGSEWLIRREARPAPARPGTPRQPAGDAPA